MGFLGRGILSNLPHGLRGSVPLCSLPPPCTVILHGLKRMSVTLTPSQIKLNQELFWVEMHIAFFFFKTNISDLGDWLHHSFPPLRQDTASLPHRWAGEGSVGGKPQHLCLKHRLIRRRFYQLRTEGHFKLL